MLSSKRSFYWIHASAKKRLPKAWSSLSACVLVVGTIMVLENKLMGERKRSANLLRNRLCMIIGNDVNKLSRSGNILSPSKWMAAVT